MKEPSCAVMRLLGRVTVAVLLFLTAAQASAAIGLQSRELPSAPKRIVVLEFLLTESLLALDVVPVGMSDPGLYPDWIGYGAERLTQVVNVGTRQQPSLEAIALLKPDLILGLSNRHAPLFPAFDRIAPTVLFDFDPGAGGGTQLDMTFTVFDAIARLTGRTGRAEQVKNQVAEALSLHRHRIAQAGLSGRQVAIMQDLGLQDTYWAFAGNSMIAGIGQRIGLQVWPKDRTHDGTRYVTTEDLMKLPATDIGMISFSGPEVSMEKKLNSPIWPYVPARKNGRIVFLERNLWYFGGPMSVIRLSELLTRSLTALPPLRGRVGD
jgi:ABC-type Fe3+-hydroxamate transport system substrate-binding protein